MAVDEKMTARQAEKEMENFKKIFQAVRLFPVEEADRIRETCREGSEGGVKPVISGKWSSSARTVWLRMRQPAGLSVRCV